MDFSIRRIDSSPVRRTGAAKRRRRDPEQPVFDLDPEAAPPAPEPRADPLEDAPVADPDPDEAGGRLDVTA